MGPRSAAAARRPLAAVAAALLLAPGAGGGSPTQTQTTVTRTLSKVGAVGSPTASRTPVPSVTQVVGPTATPTETGPHQSCATHVCGGARADWNWAGPQGQCAGECSDARCCTDGGVLASAPTWAHHQHCGDGGLAAWGNGSLITELSCTQLCDGDSECYGYHWAPNGTDPDLPSEPGDIGPCWLAREAPLPACHDAALDCDLCRYHSKVLYPWFKPSGSVEGMDLPEPPTQRCRGVQLPDSPDGPVQYCNMTPSDCQRACEAQGELCGAADWTLLEGLPFRRDARSGKHAPCKTQCTLWETWDCNSTTPAPPRVPLNVTATATLPERSSDDALGDALRAEPDAPCRSNGTCLWRRTDSAALCTVTPGEYFGHWGPLLCLVFFSALCLTSTGITCMSLRKGGSGLEGPRRTCCILFAVGVVPLSLLWLLGLSEAVRISMLRNCPEWVNPRWGRNLPFPHFNVPSMFSADVQGSVNIRYKRDPPNFTTGHAYRAVDTRGTCGADDGTRDGHFWEFSRSCWSPAAWGQQWSRLPSPGHAVWNTTFHPAMPRLGEYDVGFTCGRVTADDAYALRSNSRMQHIVSDGVLHEIEVGARVISVVQFRTKDGSCGDPAWVTVLATEGCLRSMYPQEVHGDSSRRIVFRGDCSECEWLRWQDVKNAPYMMMVINSLCSLFFSGIAGVFVDKLIPFLVKVAGKLPSAGPTIRKKCECCVPSGADEQEYSFLSCPCAPNEERQDELRRGKLHQVKLILKKTQLDADEEKLAKLSCWMLGVPGCCDLTPDWPGAPKEGEDFDYAGQEPSHPAETSYATPTQMTMPDGKLSPCHEPISDCPTHLPGDMEEPTEWSPVSSPDPRCRHEPPYGDERRTEDPDAAGDSGKEQKAPESTVSSTEAEEHEKQRKKRLRKARRELEKSAKKNRESCCHTYLYVSYWISNVKRYLADNYDAIVDKITEVLSPYESASSYARSTSAPCFFFVLVKTSYLMLAFVVTIHEVATSPGFSLWDQYQVLYVRMVNSGAPLLLLEQCRVMLAAWELLKTGQASAADKGKAVRSIFFFLLTMAVFLPPVVTHIAPMFFVFPWLLLILYVFGWQFFMQLPGYFINDVLARDWANLVQNRPFHAVALSELLGFWGKFSTSFFIVLPLQMLFNFGVLMYSGVPYWQIPGREVRSRKWDCFTDNNHGNSLAATLQEYSFYF
eukprot:TRINITY_DN47286_c0_g1_i1.p1 TRINITY_DN47286_c0_g1~~TRINITY_DN47286_c0_g1_i1.p1  ORF type:complete len:1191 (+),score=346.02 TRINITY_DN47286_c0_g1_i1:99-3671(+)